MQQVLVQNLVKSLEPDFAKDLVRIHAPETFKVAEEALRKMDRSSYMLPDAERKKKVATVEVPVKDKETEIPRHKVATLENKLQKADKGEKQTFEEKVVALITANAPRNTERPPNTCRQPWPNTPSYREVFQLRKNWTFCVRM